MCHTSVLSAMGTSRSQRIWDLDVATIMSLDIWGYSLFYRGLSNVYLCVLNVLSMPRGEWLIWKAPELSF